MKGAYLMDLNNDVKYVKGVGPNRVVLLNKLGIYTLQDLITYYPRDYEDRSKPKLINAVEDGEEALIEGYVISKMLELKVRKNLVIYKLIIRDETGPCTITWYNQPYLKKMFTVGNKYSFYGKITKKNTRVEMASPVFDSEQTQKNTGKIVPIYPSTFKLSQTTLRQQTRDFPHSSTRLVNSLTLRVLWLTPETTAALCSFLLPTWL